MVDTLSGAFVPKHLPLWLRGGTAAVFALLAARLTISADHWAIGARIAGIFLTAYLSFVFVSISFFDSATPLDDRILAPVVALMCVLIAILCRSMWERAGRICQIGTLGILLLCGVFGLRHTWILVESSLETHSATALKQAYEPLLPVLDALHTGAAIYSNEPFEIFLVTGRSARTVPRAVGYSDFKPLLATQVDASVRDMRDQLAKTRGLIVYRMRPPTHWDSGLLTPSDLTKRLPNLVQLQGRGEFSLYAFNPSRP
jgi:hypothetical protein